jgi:putative tryptophan/tyrosine transport system substrate-binding protein
VGKDLILVLIATAAAVAFAATPRSAHAEPGTSITIAAVLSGEQPAFRATLSGFEAALEKHGVHATIEVFELANAANASKATIVFAIGSPAATLMSAQGSPPVIFAVVGDPEGVNLMDRRNMPKRNATGVSALAPLHAQLQLLAAITPDAKRIGVVLSSEHSTQILETPPGNDRVLIPIIASSASAVGVALARHHDDVDVILALPDGAIWNGAAVRAAVIFSLQKKKPLFGFSSAFTRAGAVASIAAEDYSDMGAQAAEKAHALIRGEPLSSSRVLEPRKLSISINLVVARRIGVEPSRELVERAEVVFR